jgi:hypothetical protein
MRMDMRKWGALLLIATGCGYSELNTGGVEVDEEGASTNPITWVDQTKVERQSIGNCWLYATASWAEALNKAATGVEMNTSQSYTTYWHWFDQIYRGSSKISTGGTYATAVDIYRRYGLMAQAEFIPEEASSEMSARQASALERINAALSTGALSTFEARRNRTLVRAELDKAWNLSADSVALLDAVFTKGVTRTLDRSFVTVAPPSWTRLSGQVIRVLRPADLPARVHNRTTGAYDNVTLADAIGSGWSRTGAYAWTEVNYPSSATSRRNIQKRVQRALHDHQPVIISWFVDFNALGRDSSFTVERLASMGGPGHQGGHMVVMHDYEVANVPGFGTLPAGVNETRPEALQAALSDSATIKFWRIKNSWGAFRPDRWDTAELPGYHDLYQTYMNGPVRQCAANADGSPNTASCWSTQPWWDLVLPAGY